MTINEAQEQFKQQSIALTGHKNIILVSDIYTIFSGPQIIYRRIKTRSDWFIVKCITRDEFDWARNDDSVVDIQIIKPINKPNIVFNVARVWKDYSSIINLLEQNRPWNDDSCYLISPLPENEIIDLLENTIFSEYLEDTDPTSPRYQTIHLRTR
jgi:hypothetical protein